MVFAFPSPAARRQLKPQVINRHLCRAVYTPRSTSMLYLFIWSDLRCCGLTDLNWGASRMQKQTSAQSVWTGEFFLYIIAYHRAQLA